MDHSVAVRAAALLGIFADPTRLVLLAHLLTDGAFSSLAEIATATGLEERQVARAVGALATAGVVRSSGRGFTADLAPVRDAGAALAAQTPIGRRLPDHPRLRGCVKDGVIVQIPVDRGLQRELAQLVLDALEWPGPLLEAELNTRLAPMGADAANLRRLLIDERLLDRDPHTGVYVVAS